MSRKPYTLIRGDKGQTLLWQFDHSHDQAFINQVIIAIDLMVQERANRRRRPDPGHAILPRPEPT